MNTPIRQVLVHLDATRNAVQRLRAGRKIAQEHGAAIAAMYTGSAAAAVLMASPEMAPGAIAAMTEFELGSRNAARAAFDEATREPGPATSWSECATFASADAFVKQAFHADLLVLGQQEPTTALPPAPPDLATTAILGSGKPCLVIPHIGWSSEIGDTVMIAWKDTRESACAVSAALPLLQKARAVHVFQWTATASSPVQGHALDLRGFLGLHRVQALWHAGGPEPDAVGELMLSCACDLGADLLVMGCYGHSRAREWAWGGASRTVLRSMTLPVLMAH